MTNISHTYCSVRREYQKVMNIEDIVSYRCSEKKGISELDFIVGILSMTLSATIQICIWQHLEGPVSVLVFIENCSIFKSGI